MDIMGFRRLYNQQTNHINQEISHISQQINHILAGFLGVGAYLY